MEYSEKLKELKLSQCGIGLGGARYGAGIDKPMLRKMIEGFCTADDAIWIEHEKLFEMFDQYCEENNYPIVNRITLGRAFCETLGLQRQKAVTGQKLCWVYVKKQ